MLRHSATLLHPGAILAEGPVWYEGALWWVDIGAGTFNRLDPATGQNTARASGENTAAAIPCTDGRWLLAQQHSLSFYDWTTGDRTSLPSTQLPALGSRHRFNDGKADPAGRLWLGSLSLDSAPAACALFTVEPRSLPPLRTALTGVSLSNGLGWSPDGHTFYYIDTPTRRVDRFDFDPVSGALSQRRPFHTFAAADGWPDGLTVDARGDLWVALWGGGKVVCLDTATGSPRAEILLPVSQITSCAFGGPDLATLYITTAAQGLTPAQIAAEPLAGALFTARPGVTGRPPDLFQSPIP
ncbi:MAG: SMP-30/gluconolactonase/LRE family protein [Undibacterium sp.]|nr:SMP-30/gluconolactonase/LRE family protein [Opitutaceae bacterium]